MKERLVRGLLEDGLPTQSGDETGGGGITALMDGREPGDDLFFGEGGADDVGPVQPLSGELEVLEEPALVEEGEVARQRECLANGPYRENRSAPERPPVLERDPVDEDLGRDAVFDDRRIDVTRRERVGDDAPNLLVIIAKRRLFSTNAPVGEEIRADFFGDVNEEPIDADGLVDRKEVSEKCPGIPHTPFVRSTKRLERETQLGHRTTTSVLRSQHRDDEGTTAPSGRVEAAKRKRDTTKRDSFRLT